MNSALTSPVEKLGNKTLNRLVNLLALTCLLLAAGLVLTLLVVYNYSVSALNNSVSKPTVKQKIIKPTVKPQPSFGKDTTLSFVQPIQNTQSGQIFDLNLKIDTGQNTVTGVEFTLQYDPKFISIESITPSGFYEKPTVLINQKNNSLGTYKFAVGSMDPKKGNGSLVNVRVKTINPGSSQVSFQGETKVADKNAGSNNVLKSVSGITLNIQ